MLSGSHFSTRSLHLIWKVHVTRELPWYNQGVATLHKSVVEGSCFQKHLFLLPFPSLSFSDRKYVRLSSLFLRSDFGFIEGRGYRWNHDRKMLLMNEIILKCKRRKLLGFDSEFSVDSLTDTFQVSAIMSNSLMRLTYKYLHVRGVPWRCTSQWLYLRYDPMSPGSVK